MWCWWERRVDESKRRGNADNVVQIETSVDMRWRRACGRQSPAPLQCEPRIVARHAVLWVVSWGIVLWLFPVPLSWVRFVGESDHFCL